MITQMKVAISRLKEKDKMTDVLQQLPDFDIGETTPGLIALRRFLAEYLNDPKYRKIVPITILAIQLELKNRQDYVKAVYQSGGLIN